MLYLSSQFKKSSHLKLKNWIRLNLAYLGLSKKHAIFRARRWEKSLERIFKKTLYTEKYEEIGKIHDIFGPVKMPFISVKVQNEDFDPHGKFYAKLT
ncbi:MAG: hypothetical protein EU548_07945 [Promethearchaeota archaeon]|nr:MAG: hypothetical protein EU548_07945 [Candidatus Lokiarchaeota archaeon]